MITSSRILILTASHLCRNPRVVKEAATLGAAGYDVTVMSVSVRPDFERLDQDIMRGQPFQRVVLDYASASPLRRAAYFFQRCGTWTARRACATLGWESAQSLGPALALRRSARRFGADLTIVHTEIPTWVAQYLIRDGRRVAIDVEDWYSEDLLEKDRRGRPIRLLRRAEDFVLNHCAYSSATAQSMADALVAAYRCPPPIVVRNCFPLQARSRLDRAPAAGPPAFIWFSQTIGPGRGLEFFFAAWGQTQNPSRIFLLGDVRPGFRDHLLAQLPAARRDDVAFLSLVTPDELPTKLAEFDLGLALESPCPKNRDMTITNKILQYMNAGLALIATDTAGQREVMRAAPDSGLLVTAQETGHLACELDALLGDPARLRAMQVASRAAAVREFCWEKESPRILHAVAQALALPPAPSV